MDADILNEALNNESNKKFLEMTSKKIKKYKQLALADLHKSPTETNLLMNKLKGYMYVDELNDLREGSYIRWIPINNPKKLNLTRGAIFCDVSVAEGGILIKYKNFNGGNYTLKPEECLLFQKLTTQELVLIKALDYLD